MLPKEKEVIKMLKTSWWTCPICKEHKKIEPDTDCIRCHGCGRYFNSKRKEIKASDITSNMKCDLN
jgi:hypothetical protein